MEAKSSGRLLEGNILYKGKITVIKKYFTYVPLWLSILVNAILGVVASGAFLLGLIYIGGLFSEPTPKERLFGCLIMVGIFVIIVLVNYVMYRVCKKKHNNDEVTAEKKRVRVSFIVVCAVLIICVLSFFVFTDAWIEINSWWF